jgi:hypothetical protein
MVAAAAAAAVVAKNARLFICYLPRDVLPNSTGFYSNLETVVRMLGTVARAELF